MEFSIDYRRIEYETKNFGTEWVHEYVGENYNPEVGFVRRTGYYKISPDMRYTFFPKTVKKLASHGPSLDVTYLWDKDFKKLGRSYKESVVLKRTN